MGPSFATAVTVLGNARGERQLTRGEDGEEAVAELVLKLPPVVIPVDADGNPLAGATELDALALFTPGSKVTALGHAGYVLTVKAASYRGRVERVDVTTS